MIKRILTAVAIAMPLLMSGQAKKPTIMVVPSDVWCNQNGYINVIDVQGVTERIPDYERAIQTDPDLLNVITKIGELMTNNGFPLKDLSQNLKSLKQEAAENEMTVSRTSGATIAETPYDKLMNRAKADILVEVGWSVNNAGPKKSVTYTLRGLDAYTNKQVAAAQGTGNDSFSASVPVLIEEAVVGRMGNFIDQLTDYFMDIAEKGREVAVTVRIFDNGSGMSFEDEYGDEELTEIIDNWMAQNTVEHRYNLTDATDDMMVFEQVRIPLYKSNGMPMDTRSFVENLRKFLKKEPYNLTAKTQTKGLGKGVLIIGEK